jgi:hypothetical protein
MLTLASYALGVKAAILAVVAVLSAASPTVPGPDGRPGTRSQAHERLFTPVSAPAGMYEAYEVEGSIERLAAAFRDRDPAPSKGAWQIQKTGPGDAFGAEGPYDRARLAMLIGGRRISVARGALRDDDGSLVGYTLLSPYPDPTLSELRDGTLIIRVHVPPVRP